MTVEIKTLSSEEIYRNKWMALREDRILRADGSEGLYSVIEKPDFVVILPIEDDAIYVVEQFRYPLGARTIELPQGSWEHTLTATPEQVAAGELREETGLIAGKMIWIGYQKLAQGYSGQGYHIYLASELSHHAPSLDAEEVGLTARRIKNDDFMQLILNGKVTDATSVTAFLLAKARGLII
ncbi:ADP-ribose pyrophosphatase [Superficieibacter electus]|uniref:GDP-mannose pyrophosphatase n=1 Tax=Superficieibacter electus TaxID=2022662 RepID=A0A2P5GPC8_9ENTR|nr:NUDIX hydrolase [Superficieibacter electus]POP45012.1 ADP-ribose pyrophosphatase [Superficieibacter electus]POP48399.1 ADP-ribose pyrophosphatase [Superficieibacter electus]